MHPNHAAPAVAADALRHLFIAALAAIIFFMICPPWFGFWLFTSVIHCEDVSIAPCDPNWPWEQPPDRFILLGFYLPVAVFLFLFFVILVFLRKAIKK